MSFANQLRSYVLSEETFLVSILSAEAVKASQTAYWLTQIPIAKVSAQPVADIVGEVRDIENAVSSALRTAADKEVAIAAKLNALTGDVCGAGCCINWVEAPCPVFIPAAGEAEIQISENLLVNSDFEDSNTTLVGWSFTGTVGVVTPPSGSITQGYSGANVAVLSYNATTTSTLYQNIPNITGGIPVTLSFGVQATGANITLRVTLSFLQGTTIISSVFKDDILYSANNFLTLVYAQPVPTNCDNITLTFSRLGTATTQFLVIDNVVLKN